MKRKPLVYGVSVRGRSHERLGVENQDSFLVKNFGSYSLVVVSDGLGSKRKSAIGSACACRAVLKAVRMFVYRGKKYRRKKGGFSSLLSLITSFWCELIAPNPPDDCSATCLFALVSAKRLKRKTCICAALGDGMVFVSAERGWLLLTDEKDGDFVNSTFSLSAKNNLGEWQVKSLSFSAKNKLKGVFVSSDGISSDLKEGREVQFAESLLSELASVESLKQKAAFLKRIADNWTGQGGDDKTMAVLEVRHGGEYQQS